MSNVSMDSQDVGRSVTSDLGVGNQVPSWRLNTLNPMTNPQGQSEAWLTDTDGLIAALASHMPIFTISKGASDNMTPVEQQRLSVATTTAATELLVLILVHHREPLRVALVEYMKTHHLDHFLQDPVSTPELRGPETVRALLPPPDPCFGRDDERRQLEEAISAKLYHPAVILGAGGMGKTNLVLDVVNGELAKSTYGENRAFVRCTDLAEGRAILEAIAQTCGIDLLGNTDPLNEVTHYLLKHPSLIILDNLGTTLTSGDQIDVENMLRLLCTCCSLVITIRGVRSPRLFGQRVHRIELGPLNLRFARQVFAHYAPKEALRDPHVNELLRKLDFYPLAIILIARQVLRGANLQDLLGEFGAWQRTRLLVDGTTKDTSFEVSVRMSLEERDVKRFPALELLGVLSVVPDGLSENGIIRTVFKHLGRPAVDALCSVGLAFRSPVDGRVRTWQPVRDIVRNRLRPDPGQYLAQTHSSLLSVAEHGLKIGSHQGKAAIARLREEGHTIGWALSESIRTKRFDETFVKAICGLANFQRCTGFGGTRHLERAEQALAEAGRPRMAARICAERAVVLAGRSMLEEADDVASRARRSFAEQLDLEGEADCITILAKVAIKQHELETAENLARQALVLHEQCRSVRGRATSLRQLGIIATQRKQFMPAHQFFTDSLELWQTTEDLHGMASCYHGIATGLRGNGDLALASHRLEEAIDHFDRAGEVISRVFCLRDLGLVFLGRGDVDRGERKLLEALSRFTEMAIFIGMASCRRELGRCAQRKGQIMLAVQHFDAASDLYSRAEGDLEATEMRNEAATCRAHIRAQRRLSERRARNLGVPTMNGVASQGSSAPSSGYATEGSEYE